MSRLPVGNLGGIDTGMNRPPNPAADGTYDFNKHMVLKLVLKFRRNPHLQQ